MPRVALGDFEEILGNRGRNGFTRANNLFLEGVSHLSPPRPSGGRRKSPSQICLDKKQTLRRHLETLFFRYISLGKTHRGTLCVRPLSLTPFGGFCRVT